MRIIPAIDIIDGKCVRLTQGDYGKKTIYNESPLEVAKEFEANGIKYLHLVDLDGAKSGSIVNIKVLEEVCIKTNLIVDFGGGLKSNSDVEIAFSSGASKVTAGSIAIKNRSVVQEWITLYGADKIILGADVKDNQIMYNGWKSNSGIELESFVSAYQLLGVKSIISTDIKVDGMLTGPSIELYQKLQNQFPQLYVIASGGVATVQDLDDLLKIDVDAVIIGKAIYENRITLKQLQDYVD